VFPVRYELSFYIPEDGILHNHVRENLKCNKVTDNCAFAHLEFIVRPVNVGHR
jgi:hypothetical protein